MSWDINTIIPIFASITYGALFAIVVLTKPRTQLRWAFSYYLLAMFVWSVCALMVIAGGTAVLPWFRAMSSASIAMMISIFYFVQTLFSRRRNWAPYVYFYGVVSILLSLTTNLVARSAFLDEFGILQYELSPFIAIVALPGYSLMIYSLVELIKGFNRTDSAEQRNRFRYLIIGLSIILLGTLVNFTELGKYPIDIAANGITALLIAYSILRHQLLDIRLVVRIGLFYSVITAILGVLYYLILSLVINIIQPNTDVDIFILSLMVAVLSAFVFEPLRSQAQNWIDRLFYREKYNAGLMLQRLSQTTASLLDLDEIASMIVSEVSNTLQIDHVVIFIRENPSGKFVILEQLGKKLNPEFCFFSDHPVIQWLSVQKQVLTKDFLDVSPLFKSIWGFERSELDTLGSELFIPLTVKEGLVGFIAVGPKKTQLPYTRDDQTTLSTLANQTAVAIENARLFENLEETFVQTVVTLANAIDIRDTYTSNHSQQIASWGSDVARLLGCTEEEIEAIYWGGLLHDIGKIGIPDSILMKPGKLDEDEMDVIRGHPKIGAHLLAPIKKLSKVAPIIEYHHERYNGSGYPYGMKGDEIPIGARIVAVVDSFSAMIDDRPYKRSRTFEDAVNELNRCSGILYDPEVIDVFLEVIDINITITT